MITQYKAADPLDPTSQAEYKLLAGGATRTWVGTEDAYNAEKNNIPNNTMICITDDDGEYKFISPDWVNSTVLGSYSGGWNGGSWTIQKDGFLIISGVCPRGSGSDTTFVKVNNYNVIEATAGYFQSTCVPVKKNDSVVVGGSSALSNVNGSIRFCPAKITALEV